MLLDHKDALLRLSRPQHVPAAGQARVDPPELRGKALELLQLAVKLPKSKYQAEAGKLAPSVSAELRNFLQHPNVQKAPVWLTTFHAIPPRRTLQRLAAAAADAVLHARNQGHGYSCDEDFRVEIQRILDWYTPGRKSCRRKRGIRRGMKDTPWKPGRRSAVTFQVRKHFRTLLDHRMEGLLRWRLAAQALIEAGEKIVHSGTMPCERLWANFSSLLPQENRLM